MDGTLLPSMAKAYNAANGTDWEIKARCGVRFFLNSVMSSGHLAAVFTVGVNHGLSIGNARHLARRVDEILTETRCEKLNLIAHSKGGLGARHLISSPRPWLRHSSGRARPARPGSGG